MIRAFIYTSCVPALVFASLASILHIGSFLPMLTLGAVMAAVAGPAHRYLIRNAAMIDAAKARLLSPVYLLSYRTNGASLGLSVPAD